MLLSHFPRLVSDVYKRQGEHNPENGLIRLGSNQTLYLAGGAVVNAGIEATGDNITICGRGILDGSDWEHNAGPTDYMITVYYTHLDVYKRQTVSVGSQKKQKKIIWTSWLLLLVNME